MTAMTKESRHREQITANALSLFERGLTHGSTGNISVRLEDGEMVWIDTPEGAKIKVMAMLTRRVAPGVVWTPFHFGGWFQGEDLYDKYPEGTAPIVRGEACNTAFTYGYDSVTQMQETKVTLCQIEAA